MTIAERIRVTRQQKKISQKELSEKAKVNLKSLSRYELGSSIPPANILKSIADALGVSTDHLLNDNPVAITDKELFRKFEIVQSMDSDTRKTIDLFLDLVIRDFKAKKAYSS